MNFFTDIVAPSAIGIGQGISRGIQDYANIQQIREHEELAPLRKGLVQGQFNEVQRQDAEAKRLAQPYDITKHPIFKELTPEMQTYVRELHKAKGGTLGVVPKTLEELTTNNKLLDQVNDITVNKSKKEWLEFDSKKEDFIKAGATPDQIKQYEAKSNELLQKAQTVEQQVTSKINQKKIQNMIEQAPDPETKNMLKMLVDADPKEASKTLLDVYNKNKDYKRSMDLELMKMGLQFKIAQLNANARISAAKITHAGTAEDKEKTKAINKLKAFQTRNYKQPSKDKNVSDDTKLANEVQSLEIEALIAEIESGQKDYRTIKYPSSIVTETGEPDSEGRTTIKGRNVLKHKQETTQQQTTKPTSIPKSGDEVDGYIFLGGDPSQQKNWKLK